MEEEIHPKEWDELLPKRGSAAWRNASAPEKREALAHATDYINTLPFKGDRLLAHQSHSWPRKNVFTSDGTPISGVPDEIKEVVAMVAGFICAKVPYDIAAVAWVYAKIGHLIEDEVSLIDRNVTWH